MNQNIIAHKNDIIIHLQSRLTGVGNISEDNKYINLISVSEKIFK